MLSIRQKNIPASLLPLYQSAGRVDGETIWLDEKAEGYRRAVWARHRLVISNPELFPELESEGLRWSPKPRGPSGPELWSELHNKTAPTPEWFNIWLAKVARLPGCSCPRKFDAILRILPPDFTSQIAWRQRTWEWHNAVNQKLGKPAITFEEAKSRWAW